MPSKGCTALLLGCLGLFADLPGASAIETNARLKAVGSWFNADQRDSVARFGVDPAYGINLDARLTLTDTIGKESSPWSWELAGELTSLQGDVIENGSLFAGQSAGETLNLISDERRAVNLTTNISTGSRHALNMRLDRAALIWQRNKWRVRAGRQALSLGGGRVFNPMDIFSPFAPTATDRDFKNGDDALVITRLGDSGAELEAIVVARRESGRSNLSANQGSFGLRYRTSWQALEYELVAARHFDATVAMASLSGPLGGAVWRLNWVGSHERQQQQSDLTHSLMANLDYGFGFREQAGYAFIEYYHNGFGSDRSAEQITNLSAAALERLGRGELFVLEKNYLAAGTTLGLTPLLNVTTTAIVNLDDGAPLIQSALSYTAGNNLTLEGGAIFPLGGAGDEFGGITIQPSTAFTDAVLTGTSQQFYLRLVWFL